MKYNSVLGPLQQLLPTAKNILILLPASATVDHFAAGLSLYLSLAKIQKEVAIVSEGRVLVGHSNLYGVGQIQSKLPPATTGNFVITLANVANPNDPVNPIPAIDRMDWRPEGSDLKLTFIVKPGQKFEPINVASSYEGGSYDLVFVIGAPSLELLGVVYQNNPQLLKQAHVVNLDNNQTNTQYGTTKVIDPAAASLTEVVAQILPGLGLPVDGDIATNILSGVFAATNNLQSPQVSADTYLVVAESLRAGGKKPADQPNNPHLQVDRSTSNGSPEVFTEPTVVAANESAANFEVSANEDRPQGEAATTASSETEQAIEPDWLTPKVFRGGVG